KAEERIIKLTVEGLQKDEIPYKGFIFIGMIKVGNEPYVIEYNVRMSEPETEDVILRIKNDMIDLIIAISNEILNSIELNIDEQSATTVVVDSGGYPDVYEKGKEIKGTEKISDSIVFHAGTKLENGKAVTNGGRVLAITSQDKDFRKALKKSYQSIEKLHFDKMYFRKDIGFDL